MVFHCHEVLMVFGFHCTLCQCSVALQTSNDVHISIFSNYSTQVSTEVGATSDKPHFLTSDFLSLVCMIMTEPYAIGNFSYLDSWKAMISWELPGNTDFYVKTILSSVHGYGQDKVWKCWLSLSLVEGCMQNCLTLMQCYLKQCPLVSVLKVCSLYHIHNIFQWSWWCTMWTTIQIVRGGFFSCLTKKWWPHAGPCKPLRCKCNSQWRELDKLSNR
jgi:hypothetical protein